MTKTRILCVALAVAGMLLLAGSVWGSAGDSLWPEQQFTIPLYTNISLNAMSVSQTSIIICGNASGGVTQPTQIGFVKAFDVATGKLRWEHNLVLGSATNSYSAINIEGGIALILGKADGNSPEPPYTFSKSIVRACYADTGQFLWEVQKDSYQTGGGMINSYSSLIATANNRNFLAVVVPGAQLMPNTCILRAFQVKNVTTAPTTLLLDK